MNPKFNFHKLKFKANFLLRGTFYDPEMTLKIPVSVQFISNLKSNYDTLGNIILGTTSSNDIRNKVWLDLTKAQDETGCVTESDANMIIEIITNLDDDPE